MPAPVPFAPQLTTRAVTAATTVAANEFVSADASTGAYTVTGPAAGTSRRWGVKKTDSTPNAVTISYVNAAGTTSTLSLLVPDDAKTFEPLGSGYVAVSADRSRVQDDKRYSSKLASLLGRSDSVLRTIATKAVVGTAPTQSTATSATITAQTIGKSDARLTFSGPTSTTNDTNWTVAQQARLANGNLQTNTLTDQVLGVEFMFDGQALEFSALSYGGGWFVTIDGLLASTTVTAAANDGVTHFNKIDFGSRGRRRIGIWGSNFYFGGLRLAATDSVWAIGDSATPRLAILGDSYAGASNGQHPFLNYAHQLGRLLGFRTLASYASSGTGYVQANSGTGVGAYSTRVADIIAAAPDIVLVQGSLNDYQAATADFTAAVLNVLTALRTGLPDKLIIATGILDARNTASQATDAAQNTIIQTTAAALGIPYLATRNPDGTGWIFGTGKFDSTTGDGNCDLYTYGDRVHPYAPAGSDYLASRVYDGIRKLLAA